MENAKRDLPKVSPSFLTVSIYGSQVDTIDFMLTPL
jgi:hypothetical protein